MALEDDIKKAEKEEMQSQEKYGMMAMDAERMGLMNMAGMMREMAADESRHAQMMHSMIGFGNPGSQMMSQEEAEKLGMGEMHKRMTGGASGRPFPQTYMDWVDLADDIKQKMPPESWYLVNETLQIISDKEGPVAEEAKRWLTKKAGELGIS